MDNTTCTSCERKINGLNACPLWMSDGRSLGDYVYNPRCQQQYEEQLEKKFTSSFDYRQYLIENAEKIIKENNIKAQKLLQ